MPENQEEKEEVKAQAPSQPAAAVEQEVPTPLPAPEVNPTQVNVPQAVPFVPMTAEERNAEDMAHMRDIAMGHIDPKTTSSLFANKGTLGKIGSMFGLMVSGAGSGLAHQPNYLMEMINKELDRDLEAQKQNKTNAQNYLNLSYQHELQQAQAKHLGAQAAMAQAQIPQIAAQTQLAQAETQKMLAENAGLAAANSAKNKMMAAAYQHGMGLMQNNPQGQQIMQNQVLPAIMNQMQQNNQDVSGRQIMNTSLKTQQMQQQQQPRAGVDLDRMNKLIQLGKVAGEVPGAIAPGQENAFQQEAAHVNTNRDLIRMWDDSFKKLSKDALAGVQFPARRNAEMASLASRIAGLAGAQTGDEIKNIISAKFPAVGDSQKTIQEKYDKALEFFKNLETGTPHLDAYGLKAPFPNYSLGRGKNATQQPQQQTGNPDIKTVNGVRYQRGPGGIAIPMDMNNQPGPMPNRRQVGADYGTD